MKRVLWLWEINLEVHETNFSAVGYFEMRASTLTLGVMVLFSE